MQLSVNDLISKQEVNLEELKSVYIAPFSSTMLILKNTWHTPLLLL